MLDYDPSPLYGDQITVREVTEMSNSSEVHLPEAIIRTELRMPHSDNPSGQPKRISMEPSNDILLRVGELLFRRISSKSSLVRWIRNDKMSRDDKKSNSKTKATRKELATSHQKDISLNKSEELRKGRTDFQVSSPKLRSEGNRHLSSSRCKEFLTHNRNQASDEKDSRCLACCETDSNTVLMPCGHGGLCQACALQIFEEPNARCLLCREVASIYQIITDVLQYEGSKDGTLVPANLRYR